MAKKKRHGLDRTSYNEYGDDMYGNFTNLTVARLPSSKSTPQSMVQSYLRPQVTKTKTADKVNRPGLNKGAEFGFLSAADPRFVDVTNPSRNTFNPDKRSASRSQERLLNSGSANNAEKAYYAGKKTIKTNARVTTKRTRTGGK